MARMSTSRSRCPTRLCRWAPRRNCVCSF